MPLCFKKLIFISLLWFLKKLNLSAGRKNIASQLQNNDVNDGISIIISPEIIILLADALKSNALKLSLPADYNIHCFQIRIFEEKLSLVFFIPLNSLKCVTT